MNAANEPGRFGRGVTVSKRIDAERDQAGRIKPWTLCTCIQRTRRFSISSKPGMACADMAAGIQSDGTSPTSMPLNAGAATPMMVIGCLFIRTFRPTISGALPSCVFQKSSEITTKGLAPGAWSSSIVNNLPSAGLIPSTEK